MTVICTVLRSGGDFHPQHVQALHSQLNGYEFACLSDVPIDGVNVIPLRYRWSGWFSKMELFAPDSVRDDILYFDLDTVIIGDISELISGKRFRMLSDFYYPHRPASGVMFIPEAVKKLIWNKWITGPEAWIRRFRGDQDVIAAIMVNETIARFSNNIISYKVHVAKKGMPGYVRGRSKGNGTIPETAKVLCFHGYPRPWEIDMSILSSSGTQKDFLTVQ